VRNLALPDGPPRPMFCSPWSVKIQGLRRHISVFGPLGGAAARGQQRPAPVAPKGIQTQQSFLRGPSPKLAGPLDCTRMLPPSSYPPPHGPAHSSAVAHSDRPSATGVPADNPGGPPFPRLQRPSYSSSSKRPCFHPWRSHPVGGLASTLARLPQRRQATAVHAPPRFRTAPPNSRSVWSAPACWRCWKAILPPECYRLPIISISTPAG